MVYYLAISMLSVNLLFGFFLNRNGIIDFGNF